MENVKKIIYSKWSFSVDIERTQAFYKTFTIQNSHAQSYRNYLEYIKDLDSEEKDFFKAFGIDLHKPFASNSLLFNRYKNYYAYLGSYIFFGEVLDGPKEEDMWMELDEFTELDEEAALEHAQKNFSIKVGRFEFDVANPKSDFYEWPEEIPEGAIALNLNIECIPWVLNEPVSDITFESAKWWDISGKISDYLRIRKIRKKI